MRIRSRAAMFAGTVAVAGLATPASAATTTTSAQLPGLSQQIHKLTAKQAGKIMAAARARALRGAGGRAVVRSAGEAGPDANGGHSMPLDCNGFWQIFGGKGFADAIGYTSNDCTRYQSLYASATVSRDRWYGWENQAYRSKFVGSGEFVSAEAVWRCQGVGTYTYRNFFTDSTHYGGYSGVIESRFTC